MDSKQLYHASLSTRFMAASILACCFLSFSLGKMARLVLLPEQPQVGVSPQRLLDARLDLPAPLARGGKEVPQSLYTTKFFDSRSSVMSSQWLQKEERDNANTTSDDYIPAPRNERLLRLNATDNSEMEEDDEEHLPAGQHLLMDIDGIDGSFLNSEQKLATAMVQLVDDSGLTLLSYHCHGLKPAGVSCAGVLLESHVAFHTWPAEGVITLDLFTCGAASLLSSVQLIADLFAIPKQGNVEPPRVLWAYKRRGFKYQTTLNGSRDTFAYPLGLHGIEMKKEVASIRTDHGKQAWIYDIQEPNQSTMEEDNRLFYLDGVMKSNRLGEIAAYESFVHPSMMAHENPKRILLLGPGAGASVREALKHNSVEDIVTVGADKSLLEFARANLPEWSDCSDLVGIHQNCLDDARVTINYENPNTWLSNYLSTDRGKQDAFDIALVDLFDLEEEVASELMQNRESFFRDLYRVLSKEGIVAVHVSGDVRAVDSPRMNEYGSRAVERRDRKIAVVSDLAKTGFSESKEYKEFQLGFPDTRSYVVAFKSIDSVGQWNRNEAQVNHEMCQRSVATKSGTSPFHFFDGATMNSYNQRSDDQYAKTCDEEDTTWCDRKAKLDALARSSLANAKLEAIVTAQESEDNNMSDPKNNDRCSDQTQNASCEWSEGGSSAQQPLQYAYLES